MGWHVGECLLLDVLKRENMIQAEYARRVGVSRQYVQKLINNESKMSIELLLNSCHVLNCEKDDLYKIKFNPEEG